MIEPELARRFIEQVTQFTEYNINIMDENGVIPGGSALIMRWRTALSREPGM